MPSDDADDPDSHLASVAPMTSCFIPAPYRRRADAKQETHRPWRLYRRYERFLLFPRSLPRLNSLPALFSFRSMAV